MIRASIPNGEIRSEFQRWIRMDLAKRLPPELRGRSAELFRNLVNGSMASFAQKLRKIVFDSMPSQYFGSEENVYQAYIKAYLEYAATAVHISPGPMICRAGADYRHLVFRRKGSAVLIELKWAKHEKGEGYRESERQELTKLTGVAMEQLKSRPALPEHVTKLRLYGVGFLGPYCAIEGQLLERKTGEQWVVKQSYSVEKDEKDRARVYTTVVPVDS
jgi:hypothetical protein